MRHLDRFYRRPSVSSANSHATKCSTMINDPVIDAIRSRDSSVGIVTGCGLDSHGSIQKMFLYFSIKRGSGTYTTSYTMGTGVKRPGREAIPKGVRCALLLSNGCSLGMTLLGRSTFRPFPLQVATTATQTSKGCLQLDQT
jgi:hypothetical protein